MDRLDMAQTKQFDSSLGTFTCKIPSLPQRLEISRRTHNYGGGASPLSVVDWEIAEGFAIMDVVVTEAPEGFKKTEAGAWNYGHVYDIDGFLALVKEVKKWIDSFRGDVRGKQDGVGAQGRTDS